MAAVGRDRCCRRSGSVAAATGIGLAGYRRMGGESLLDSGNSVHEDHFRLAGAAREGCRRGLGDQGWSGTRVRLRTGDDPAKVRLPRFSGDDFGRDMCAEPHPMLLLLHAPLTSAGAGAAMTWPARPRLPGRTLGGPPVDPPGKPAGPVEVGRGLDRAGGSGRVASGRVASGRVGQRAGRVGSPVAAQPWNPPITSVARRRPSCCNESAARLEV